MLDLYHQNVSVDSAYITNTYTQIQINLDRMIFTDISARFFKIFFFKFKAFQCLENNFFNSRLFNAGFTTVPALPVARPDEF